ncbi:MAG: hypothetical protein EXQ87_07535 [Alphaproteobacteria bacterium]|nr:hypothetical protein [Alphaproteobacteria bacterium]
MAPKRNPLKLNPLQLKTLTLLQEIARLDGHGMTDPATGEIAIANLPHAHGNHFHVGDYVVRGSDATGLRNEAVYTALHRKGLVRLEPATGLVLTVPGRDYETGVREQILLRTDH